MHVDQAERLTNVGGADSDRSRETEVEDPAHGLRVGEEEDYEANRVALANSVVGAGADNGEEQVITEQAGEVEEPAHGLRVGEDEDDDANLVALADSVEAARDASHQADGAGDISDEHVSSDEDEQVAATPALSQNEDGSWTCRVCNTRKPSLAANKNRRVCKKCDGKVDSRYKKGLENLECKGLDGQCILPANCPGCLVARFVWWGHYPNSEQYNGEKILEFETWLSDYPHPDPFDNTDRQERIRRLRPA